MTAPSRITRRCVVYVGGYEAARPAGIHARFARVLGKFREVWGCEAGVGDVGEEPGRATWEATARWPGGDTACAFVLLRWDDCVARDLARAAPVRWAFAAAAFVRFVAAGTFGRYVRLRWPYALFFLYPFACAAGLAAGVVAAVGIGAWLGGLVGGLAAGALAVLVLRWGGARRLRIDQALEDWVFADAWARQRRPDVSARVAQWAACLRAIADSDRYDEIVVIGHSFGATLALEVLATWLRDGGWNGGVAVRLLTLGATIPKLGLHPPAAHVREAARTVAASGVRWLEIQAHEDPISFYKVDPVTMVRRVAYGPEDNPCVRRIPVRTLVSEALWERIRRHPLRLHYQCVLANDVRARFDWMAYCVGPLPFDTVADHAGGVAGAYREAGIVA